MYWMILEIYGLRYSIIGQVPEADRKEINYILLKSSPALMTSKILF